MRITQYSRRSSNAAGESDRRLSTRLLAVIVLLSMLCFACAPTARGEDFYWKAEDGDFSTADNWDKGTVPVSSSDKAIIDNGGTATIASNYSLGPITFVGDSETGTLALTSGVQVTAYRDMYIGNSAGGNGTVTMDAASITCDTVNTIYVGRLGTGTLAMTNGSSVTTKAFTVIGLSKGSTGTVTMESASTMTVTGGTSRLSVGENGTGTLTLNTGSSVESEGSISIGYQSGGNGTTTVDGSASTLTASRNLTIGYNGTGTLTLTGGGTAKSTTGNIVIGTYASGSGRVMVGSGSFLTSSGSVYVADGTESTGAAWLGGTGTITVGASGSVAVGRWGTLSPGDAAGAIGTLNIAGDLTLGIAGGTPGSLLDLDLGDSDNDKIAVTGAVTINENLNIKANNAKVGTFDAITAGSAIDTANLDTAIVTGVIDGYSVIRRNNSVKTKSGDDKTLQFTIGDTVGNLTLNWTGAKNANWNTGATDLNWSDTITGSAETRFMTGDSIVLDRAKATPGSIVIDSDGITAGAVNVKNTGDWTFTGGSITGTTLTKESTSTGTLTLNANAAFTDDVVINAGTLAVGSGKTLTVTDAITIANGATLALVAGNSTSITADSIGFGASGSLSITGISADVGESFTKTVITTTTGVTGFDPANVTIASQPTTDFLFATAEPDSESKDIVVTTGLSWYSKDAARKAHGAFTLADADDSFTVAQVLADNSTNLATSWNGDKLTKKGAGTLILTAANTYTGGSDVQAGALKATNLAALGTGVATVQSGATIEANFASLAATDMTGLAGMVGQIDLKAGGAFTLAVADDYAIDANLTLSAAAAGSTFTLASADRTVTLASGRTIDAKGATISLAADTSLAGANAALATTGDIAVAGALVADGGDFALTASSVDFAAGGGIAIGVNAAGDGAAKITVTGDITVATTASVSLRESLVNLGEAAYGSVILASTGSFSAADAAKFTLPTDMFTAYSLDASANPNALTLIAKKRSEGEQEDILIGQVESVTGVDRDSAYTSIHTATDGTFSTSMTNAFGSSSTPASQAFGAFTTYADNTPGWTWSDALAAVRGSGDPALAGMTLEGLQNTVYLRQIAMGTATGLSSGDNWVMTGAAAASAVDASLATVGRIADLNLNHGMTLTKQALAPAPAARSGSAFPSLLVSSPHANRVWAGAFGVWEDMGKKDGYAGYKYDAHGFIVGYDRYFGPIALGASFAYARGSLDEKEIRGDGDIDSYSANLYASYTHRSGVFAFAHGGYTYSDNKLTRIVNSATNRSDYHTNTWNVGARVGYQASLTPRLTLTPTAGLEYIHAKNNDFTANGGIFQRYSGVKGESLRAPVEVEASYRADVGCDSSVTFTAKGGYAYEFKNKGVTGTMTYVGVPGWNPTSIRGVKPGRHSWTAGAGVKYESKRFDAELTYQYTGRKKFTNHQVMATVGLKF